MNLDVFARTGLARRRGILGAILVLAGEGLLLSRHRPLSDYSFHLLWFGYVFFLDASVDAYGGYSLWSRKRTVFLAMFPVSAAFWWTFELFNVAVHNWVYVGIADYSATRYVVFASVAFSTVLPAVWTTALCLTALLPAHVRSSRRVAVSRALLAVLFACGVLAVMLPVLFPRQAFPLVWVSLLLLLDPINAWFGRPSIIAALLSRQWRVPLTFALAGLICGFFWEAWNEWAMPQWVYNIPYVGFWHVFKMPLLGWGGYLPFGLELFAMANFALPCLGLGTLTLPEGDCLSGYSATAPLSAPAAPSSRRTAC